MPCLTVDFDNAIKKLPQPEGHFDIEGHKKIHSYDVESDVWEERLNEFLDYLTEGKLPVGVECKSPKLSHSQAASVLWFLSEVSGIIPCEYEMCYNCKAIYNADRMSYFETNGKHYCDNCVNNAPVGKCEECETEEIVKSRDYSKKHDLYLCKSCRKKGREK